MGANQVVSGQDFGNILLPPENSPPQFTSVPPNRADVDQLLRYQAVAADPDNDPLVFDLPLAPDGMTVHEQFGTVVWQPTADQVGQHTVVLRAGREGGVDLQSFDIQVVCLTRLRSSRPRRRSRRSRICRTSIRVRAQEADGDPLHYELTTVPLGMTVGLPTGVLTWTPTVAQVGSHPVAILVTDGRGGQVTQSFTLPVVAVATNDPPVITSTPCG